MHSLALREPIGWPGVCACCCRDADTTVGLKKTVEESSYNWFINTTTTRSETRSCEVPYCKSCLEHIHAARALQEFNPAATHMSAVVGGVGGLVWLVVALVSMQAVTSPVLQYSLIGSVLALVALATWVTYPMCSAAYKRKAARIAADRAVLQERVDANVGQTCSARGHLAVRYEGWCEETHYGEWRVVWHHFSFQSALYADLVAHINADNCKRV
jgi:hypothetical protein